MTDYGFHVLAYLASAPGREGYGWRIMRWLQHERDAKISRGAVYKVLIKLKERGFVDSRLGDPKDRFAGHRRTYYRLTLAGENQFLTHCEEMEKLIGHLSDSIARGKKTLESKRRAG